MGKGRARKERGKDRRREGVGRKGAIRRGCVEGDRERKGNIHTGSRRNGGKGGSEGEL